MPVRLERFGLEFDQNSAPTTHSSLYGMQQKDTGQEHNLGVQANSTEPLLSNEPQQEDCTMSFYQFNNSASHLIMERSGLHQGTATTTNGNNALQDYQMQCMLLEQQNKKRLLVARQQRKERMSRSDNSMKAIRSVTRAKRGREEDEDTTEHQVASKDWLFEYHHQEMGNSDVVQMLLARWTVSSSI